jgi:hypothetical protein
MPADSLAMLVIKVDTASKFLHAWSGLYHLPAPGGYILLDGFDGCSECEATEAFKSTLGVVPHMQAAPPLGKWFYKPVTVPLDFSAVQGLLMHASFKAMQLSYGGWTFVDMGHSFECPEQAAFLRNAARYRGVQHVCEIGFNAGHGAINMLAANLNASMVCFDLSHLPWSVGMVGFVQQLFPGRFTYIKGNSREGVPRYAADVRSGRQAACDLFFMDGDRSYEGSKIDFNNAIHALSPAGYLIADDYHPGFSGLVQAWDELVASGRVQELTCQQTRERYRGYQKGWCVGRVTSNALPPVTHIHVATAQCGTSTDLLLEFEVLVKTMLMAADPLDHIHLHAVLGKMDDDEVGATFMERLHSLANSLNGVFSLRVYEPFPDIVDLFKPCATQGLSLHKLVPDSIDCALFLDRDTIIVSSLKGFIDTACGLQDKLLAMSQETRGIGNGNPPSHYTHAHGARNASITYVAPTGVNSGVLGMNLKKLREVDFERIVADACNRYSAQGSDMTLGDQDILNGYFVEHPRLLEFIDCKYNSRVSGDPEECDCCPVSIEDSVVLHGNRAAFTNAAS